MPHATPARHIHEVSRLIEERLGLAGPTIRHQIARLGRRRLPRTLRADIAELAEADLLLTHPKLSRQVDAARVARRAELAGAALKRIDPRAERITRLLRWLASVAAVLILTFVVAVWWMVRTGRV